MGRGEALSSLFGELVERNFQNFAYLEDSAVKSYVTALLLDFVKAENLYRIRDARNRALEDVGEMLIQSNPLLEGTSFVYERDVRKHIGDFTLFFSGMFPESIGKWRMRSLRLDSFVDYVKAGKESYHIVAEFNLLDAPATAPLFRRLSEEFERCVYGLNMVRRDLDIGQPKALGGVRDIIM